MKNIWFKWTMKTLRLSLQKWTHSLVKWSLKSASTSFSDRPRCVMEMLISFAVWVKQRRIIFNQIIYVLLCKTTKITGENSKKEEVSITRIFQMVYFEHWSAKSTDVYLRIYFCIFNHSRDTNLHRITSEYLYISLYIEGIKGILNKYSSFTKPFFTCYSSE
jgi:hypothetical protein